MPKKRANYTEEEKAIALAYYHECRSAKKTVRDLGYPVRSCLNNWIAAEGKPKQPRKKNSINKGLSTFEERLDVVHRCVDLGEDVHLVAKEHNRDVSTIYTWCRIYKKEGHIALMKKPKKKQPATAVNEIDNIEELKAKMLELQLENDILRETINVLKKDPGINQAALTNREKAVIVDALKDNYWRNWNSPKVVITIRKSVCVSRTNILNCVKEYAKFSMKTRKDTDIAEYGQFSPWERVQLRYLRK